MFGRVHRAQSGHPSQPRSPFSVVKQCCKMV